MVLVFMKVVVMRMVFELSMMDWNDLDDERIVCVEDNCCV